MRYGRRHEAGRVSGLVALACLLFVLSGLTASHAEDLPRASDFNMAGDATKTRIVLNFDREPQVKWLLLRAPHRLVIDLPESVFAIDPQDLKPRGLVAGVRYGHLDAGRSRLILSSKGPFAVESLDVLANEDGKGFRLAVDMAAASEAAFETALAAQADKTGSIAAPKGDRVGASNPAPARKFTIAIDPGHGGIDGGAESETGTVEKDITLTFGRELRDRLAASGDYTVIMTRDKDEFLRLDDRVRIARQAGADLFISIHADTIRVKGVHGATVYTVSDRASDEEARALAERENLADQAAGFSIAEDNQQVADILVDLIRRETHDFSIRFARSLVGELSGSIDLIKNPHRSAGFRVLRAPDVPSVLVELGYLSNERDEERLRDPEWRSKAADSIVSAVGGFATRRVGAGG